MKQITVYLAGGIQGVDNPAGWRNRASEYLITNGRKKGIEVTILDPLRGKTPDEYDTYTALEVVVRDKADVRKSDVILVEMMNPDRPYVGTSMEILYAFEHSKPVVLWSDYPSYWLDAHCVKRFSYLYESCDYILDFWG